ncbi:hypothetical protein HU200_021198 [Digitaria exilis]|uniref:Disease resistance N-terminal domain-containing protein n=1 Tax=Digitaria exilis TaxID=1010633 RepID=A0A835KE26_9POAL|nr:hypothetical protein HU200_021198 [Digitaria exilis]
MEAAVVSSTEGVLRIVLGKLGDVIASKYALVCGVHVEIQELKDELESMNSCLRDLAAGSDDNHSEQVSRPLPRTFQIIAGEQRTQS